MKRLCIFILLLMGFYGIAQEKAHQNLIDLELSRQIYLQALEKYEVSNDSLGIAQSLIHLADIDFKEDMFNDAREKYAQALSISKSRHFQYEQATSTFGLAKINEVEKKDQKAISLFKEVIVIAKHIKEFKLISEASLHLSEIYESKGHHSWALDMFRVHMASRDSVLKEENKRATIKQEYQYVYDKQALADSLEFAKKEAIKNLEIEKRDAELSEQKVIIIASAGGLLLLILLAISIRKGKKRSDELLYNILPIDVAEELKKKGFSKARQFENVTILFSDFKGFTEISSKLSPSELVKEINTCFKAFDEIMERHNIEKIKTIGDAYMAAGGLHFERNSNPKDVVLAAFEMQEFIQKRLKENQSLGKPSFEMRVGIHTGPVVAGIVGLKKFQYDIWGDSVNTASRMESNGEVGKVNISDATYQLIKNEASFSFTEREELKVKGKGLMKMLFVALKK